MLENNLKTIDMKTVNTIMITAAMLALWHGGCANDMRTMCLDITLACLFLGIAWIMRKGAQDEA
jgi:uncharacterized membrane protein YozB (DUF420 family)